MVKALAKPPQSASKVDLFVSHLPGATPRLSLSMIASALYKTAKARDTALLTALQDGELVAYLRWLSEGDPVLLPTDLWQKVSSASFKVRRRRNRRWRHYPYNVPVDLLLKHCVHPLILTVQKELALPSKEHYGSAQPQVHTCDRSDTADALKALGMAALLLSQPPTEHRPFILRSDAIAFSRKRFGYFESPDKRGRPKTPNSDKLLLEIFARLAAEKLPLPNQKRFVSEVHGWWNDRYPQDQRSEEFIRQKVQAVWRAVEFSRVSPE